MLGRWLMRWACALMGANVRLPQDHTAQDKISRDISGDDATGDGPSGWWLGLADRLRPGAKVVTRYELMVQAMINLALAELDVVLELNGLGRDDLARDVFPMADVHNLMIHLCVPDYEAKDEWERRLYLGCQLRDNTSAVLDQMKIVLAAMLDRAIVEAAERRAEALFGGKG